MARSKKPPRESSTNHPQRSVKLEEKSLKLKELAAHLGLAPATVSFVVNGSAMADTIAPETRELILKTARKLGYRANFFARCLRTRRSFTIGVMVPEASAGYNVTVLSGVEDHLLEEEYFYLVASHHFRPDLIHEYTEQFLHRSVDGLIVVNTPWERPLNLPVATISSHHSVAGVASILLDHDRAAELALKHLVELGHARIAFIKGQAFVPDTETRWNSIVKVAGQMGLPIHPKLVTQIEENSPLPHLGYKVTQDLLVSREPFTALFAFNDISAFGAIRALHEFGLRVPEDVSVLGFDDIESAAYQSRGLSTIKQPLKLMGKAAAQNVLHRIVHPDESLDPSSFRIVFEPELVVRETTAVARKQPKMGKRLAEA